MASVAGIWGFSHLWLAGGKLLLAHFPRIIATLPSMLGPTIATSVWLKTAFSKSLFIGIFFRAKATGLSTLSVLSGRYWKQWFKNNFTNALRAVIMAAPSIVFYTLHILNSAYHIAYELYRHYPTIRTLLRTRGTRGIVEHIGEEAPEHMREAVARQLDSNHGNPDHTLKARLQGRGKEPIVQCLEQTLCQVEEKNPEFFEKLKKCWHTQPLYLCAQDDARQDEEEKAYEILDSCYFEEKAPEPFLFFGLAIPADMQDNLKKQVAAELSKENSMNLDCAPLLNDSRKKPKPLEEKIPEAIAKHNLYTLFFSSSFQKALNPLFTQTHTINGISKAQDVENRTKLSRGDISSGALHLWNTVLSDETVQKKFSKKLGS